MDSEKTPTASATLREKRSKTATRLFRERRFRTEYFSDSDVFGEPAWDILLHLFQGHAYGRSIKIESIALATGLPATASLRWLEVLEKKGLVFAYREENEIGQIYVRLSSKGLQDMTRYLDHIAHSETRESA